MKHTLTVSHSSYNQDNKVEPKCDELGRGCELKGAASTPEERPPAAGERLAKEVKGHLAVWSRGGRHLFTSWRPSGSPVAVRLAPPLSRRSLRESSSLDFAALSAGTQTPQGHRLRSPLCCLTDEAGERKKK